jgi:lipoprotein-anchoring transpeptidase ErfK/SrfK
MRNLLGAALLLFAGLSTPAIAGAIEARIDISEQRMNVYQNGVLRHTWAISTGRKGYITPTGNYRPTRLTKMHYSRKYHNSPMPYSIFFRGGYAIHGTGAVKQLGRPASHGCIRLHTDNARALYGMVQSAGAKNTRISITH